MAKIRKFFKQPVQQIDGPKEKLNFLGPKEEIKEEQAREMVDNFFEKHREAENADLMKAQVWSLILNGKDINVDGTNLTSKVYNISDKRIAARTS